MPQRTKVNHPISQLRIAAKLRRKELAALIGIKTNTLEALERTNRRIKPAIIEALYRELGVCPGWIASGQGPIHTHDGHPYQIKEYLRWRAWREELDKPEEPVVTQPTGYQGREQGPFFKRDCCPGPLRDMMYGPIEGNPKGAGSPRAFQKQMAKERIKQYAFDFMDLARGAVSQALKDPKTAEVKLSEAVSKIRLVFPDAKPEKDDFYGELLDYYFSVKRKNRTRGKRKGSGTVSKPADHTTGSVQ